MATKRPTHGNVTELPDGAADATGLTPRQQRVLAHIKESIEHAGLPARACARSARRSG